MQSHTHKGDLQESFTNLSLIHHHYNKSNSKYMPCRQQDNSINTHMKADPSKGQTGWKKDKKKLFNLSNASFSNVSEHGFLKSIRRCDKGQTEEN